jgi:hypothetical protein
LANFSVVLKVSVSKIVVALSRKQRLANLNLYGSDTRISLRIAAIVQLSSDDSSSLIIPNTYKNTTTISQNVAGFGDGMRGWFISMLV